MSIPSLDGDGNFRYTVPMHGTDQKPITFQYGQVEAALAEVMNVKAEGLGAFRARLRHMRNIGVPQLPKPGAGKKIAYTAAMAFEMLLVLELERAGHPPRVAALAGPKISGALSSYLDEGEDAYVFVGTPEEGGFLYYAKGEQTLLKMLKVAPRSSILLKLSEISRELVKALKRTMAV